MPGLMSWSCGRGQLRQAQHRAGAVGQIVSRSPVGGLAIMQLMSAPEAWHSVSQYSSCLIG